MTIRIGRSMEREEHFVGDKRYLVYSVKESLRGEKFTDCILITKEGIPVPVHRMVLTPSPLLERLFMATSCCRGLCSHATTTTISLPDVPYLMLNILLGFFYTGTIRCTSSEMDTVKDLLVNMFLVPKNTVMLHKRDGYTDCVECAQHLPVTDLMEHLVSNHVEDPCLRDMARVEEGDSRAVSCSQHPGVKACDVDLEKTRISNGIFNYVGKADAVSCVLEHYRIHFDNMLQYVRKEYPAIVINSRFDEVKLRQLSRNTTSLLLEPSTARINWSTRADVDKFLQSSTAPDSASTPSRPGPSPPSPPPSAPTTHSGGLSSPEELSDKASKADEPFKQQKKTGKRNTKHKSALSSSSSGSSSDGNTSDSFSDPPGAAVVRSGSSHSGNYFPASQKPGAHSQGSSNNSGNSTPGGVKKTPAWTSKDIIRNNSSVGNVKSNSASSSSSIFNPVNSISSLGSNKRKVSDDDSKGSNNLSAATSNLNQVNTVPTAKKPRMSSQDHKKCRLCQKSQFESQFVKHVTSHLYHLWPEVVRGDKSQHCSKEGCGRQFSNWKYYIGHLATQHNELTKKLSLRDESISDYEMMETEVTSVGMGEIGSLSTLTASSKREVLARHDKPTDYLDKISPRRDEPLASLNSSQNPLLDSSQDDALVIVENGDEDIDVNDLLDDSQDDPEVKCTIPVLPLSIATPPGVSPIVIDTSQSDSDAATMQENTNIIVVKSPATKDDDSDATAPWDGEENEERMKDVED